jgi:hypothetical protein
MNEPNSLIDGYLDGALDDAGRNELLAWLKADATNMRSFTEAVMFEQQIRAALHAKTDAASGLAQVEDISLPTTEPPSAGIHPFRALARAAVWVGAFIGLGNKAQAAAAATSATTILMTKTAITITVTAAILIAGGGSLYLIHRENEQAAARVSELRSQLDSMETNPGTATPLPQSQTIPAPVQTSSSASEFLAKFNRMYGGSSSITQAEAQQIIEELNAMDAKMLKELILEAERLGKVHPLAIYEILLRLGPKSPADGTMLGARLAANASKFDKGWAEAAGYAFKKWLATEPDAANAWYLSAVASGELVPKSIPPAGQEERAPDRLFARLRFTDLLRSDPRAAESMLAAMLPEDVAKSVRSMEDSTPELVARITRLLPPSQQVATAQLTVQRMINNDFNSAIDWVNSLEIGDVQRGGLLADAVQTAHRKGKLALNDVAEWAKSPAIGAEERASMLVEVARTESFIDGKGWQWDTMAERNAWLRQTLPAGQAGQAVGTLLGSLAQYDTDLAIKAYEREAALGATPDPLLEAGFAEGLSKKGDPKSIREALRIIESMPVGAEREKVRQTIENNRR